MDILLLWLCVATFVVLQFVTSMEAKKEFLFHIGWLVVVIAGYYFLMAFFGGKPPFFELFGRLLPLWLLVPLAICSGVWLVSGKSSSLGLFVVFSVAIVASYFRPFAIFHQWLQRDSTPYLNLVFSVGFIATLSLTTWIPVSMMRRFPPFSIDVSPFSLPTIEFGKQWKMLFGTLVIWCLVVLVGNLFIDSSYFTLRVYKSFDAFLASCAIHFVALVLVDHVISFGLFRALLHKYSPGFESEWGGIFLSATVFVGLHYYLSPGNMVQWLALGAVYAYLAARTSRLTYGIALNMFTAVLLAN